MGLIADILEYERKRIEERKQKRSKLEEIETDQIKEKLTNLELEYESEEIWQQPDVAEQLGNLQDSLKDENYNYLIPSAELEELEVVLKRAKERLAKRDEEIRKEKLRIEEEQFKKEEEIRLELIRKKQEQFKKEEEIRLELIRKQQEEETQRKLKEQEQERLRKLKEQEELAKKEQELLRKKKELESLKVTLSQLVLQKYVGSTSEEQGIIKFVREKAPSLMQPEEIKDAIGKLQVIAQEIKNRKEKLSSSQKELEEYLVQVPDLYRTAVEKALKNSEIRKQFNITLQEAHSGAKSVEDVAVVLEKLKKEIDGLVNVQKEFVVKIQEYWNIASSTIQEIEILFKPFSIEPMKAVAGSIQIISVAATTGVPTELLIYETNKSKIDNRLKNVKIVLETLKSIDFTIESKGWLATDQVMKTQWQLILKLMEPELIVPPSFAAPCLRILDRIKFRLDVKEATAKIETLSEQLEEAIKLTKFQGLIEKKAELQKILEMEPFNSEAFEKQILAIEQELIKCKEKIEEGRKLVIARGAELERRSFTIDRRCIGNVRGEGELRVRTAVFEGDGAITWNKHALGKKSGHDWTGWSSMQYTPGNGNNVLLYKWSGNTFTIGATGTHRKDTYDVSPDLEQGLQGQSVAIVHYTNDEYVFEW